MQRIDRQPGIPDEDKRQRQAALDIGQSFIVQAPAGSGKTTLLIHRYLTLLAAAVDQPEQILALTFTRKAADEMRARILQALTTAEERFDVDVSRPRDSCDPAWRALWRDKRCGWRLSTNPERLQIMTIDGFCAAVTRKMPVLSRLGANFEPVDSASGQDRALYELAADRLLQDLDRYPAAARVLAHFNNSTETLRRHLADMLSKRDQWLPYIVKMRRQDREPHDLRERLENGLRIMLSEHVEQLERHCQARRRKTLADCLAYAQNHMSAKDEIRDCSDPFSSNQAFWRLATKIFLTRDAKVRKLFNKTVGFPAPTQFSAAQEKRQAEIMKAEAKALASEIESDETLCTALRRFNRLPDPCYRHDEWEVIEALAETLTQAVAYLKLVFQEQALVDYIEIAQAADRALGEPQAPSRLALMLDYQIRHILIDEFQDTSAAQFYLLEKLTAGWQAEDGRTLFFVGDPMQSIYKFRRAEVGLFLRVKYHGINDMRPKPICLSANFRSTAAVVSAINDIFPRVFPPEDNIGEGAVSYSPIVSARTDNTSATQNDRACHMHLAEDEPNEARQVVRLVREAAGDSVAVLVRSRSHANTILPQLRRAGITYRADAMKSLAQCEPVPDLLALTRAVMHCGDDVAWSAILRAPWCALSLDDLYWLAAERHEYTLYDCLRDPDRMNRLSRDGRRRATIIYHVLDRALHDRQRKPLSHIVQSSWLALNGPICLSEADALHNAERYFIFLDEIVKQYPDIQAYEIEKKINLIYSDETTGSPADKAPVHIMTVHKAKGLEFDSVILPGLGRSTKRDDADVLMWQLRPGEHASSEDGLIIAPKPARVTKTRDIYGYLCHAERQKSAYETQRLLYVAMTRAKRQIHLLVDKQSLRKKDGIRVPKNSLLYPIRFLIDGIAATQVKSTLEETTSALPVEPVMRRLK